MKKIFLICSLIVSVVFSSEINWAKDYTNALSEAKNTNKPILLLIDSPNCPYCQLLKEDVLSSDLVSSFINENFVPIIVRQNDGTYPSDIFTVRGTPTTFFVKKNGEPYLSPIIGYVKEDKYFKYLKIGFEYY